MPLKRGVTSAWVQSLRDKILTGATMDADGNLSFTREDASSVLIGDVRESIVPPSYSIVPLSGVGVTTHQVVVPEFGGVPALLAMPVSGLPASTEASDCSWTKDGRYLAVAHSLSPYVTLFSRSGAALTKEADPATLPPTTAKKAAWSPDGQYLAVIFDTSPHFHIYSRSGSTLTKLTNPGSLPSANLTDVTWSPDSTIVSFSSTASPYVINYKWTGSAFVKMADIAFITTAVNKVVWSPNGRHVLIARTSGSQLCRFTNPSSFTNVLPPYGGSEKIFDATYNPNGQYLAMIRSDEPRLFVYHREGLTYTPVANLDPTSLSGTVKTVAWSPDGRYLAVGLSAWPFVLIYQLTGLGLERTSGPMIMSADFSEVVDVEWSPDGHLLSVVTKSPPGLLSCSSGQSQPRGVNPRPLVIDATY